MNKNIKAYNKLKEEYTTEELADSVLIPEELSESELEKVNKEFLELRMKRRESRTEKEKLYSSLLHLKYQLKGYLNTKNIETKFGEILKKYIKMVGRNQRQFAEEIGLHPSRLNRIIKGKERIGKSIAYRLENHSGELIPAIYWWKLMQREVEKEILTEKKAREIERKFVKKVAYRA